MKKYHVKKHILIIITFMFFVVCMNKFDIVLANENSSDSNNSGIQELKETQENDISKEQIKKEALKNIEECKENIRAKLKEIDDKIKSIKQKEEYKTYPAIRLNVDTPLFGLSSVCNQKLKITSEVSTADVVRGYNIKDVLKTNSLKVPSFSVGSITVMTRDIKFDESITLADANTSILKLIQYYEQVESVEKFLDKQVIKIYSEYIPKEKSQKIEDLKKRISNINSEKQGIDKQILQIYLCRINEEKYSELLTSYMNVNDKVYKYTKVLENVLIDDDDLLQAEKDVIALEAEFVNLKEQVKNTLSVTSNEEFDYNFEEIFKNSYENLVARKEKIEEYIEKSELKKEIKNEENIDENEYSNKNINSTNNNDNSDSNSSSESESSSFEEIKIYDVTDINSLTKIEEKIKGLEDVIKNELGEFTLKKIKGELTEELAEEAANKEEVTSIKLKEKSKEEKEKIIQDVITIYNEVLTYENSFYTNNINLLLKDSTNKVNTLAKYTDYSNISDIKYIYLELPKLLKKDIEVYSQKNTLEINKLTSNIKEKLNKIVEINKIVSSEYEKKVPENVKNS